MSFFDVLLIRPMKQILYGLPISERIMQALLGDRNEYRELLDCVIAGESADWNNAGYPYTMDRIDARRFMELYLESLRWAKTLNY